MKALLKSKLFGNASILMASRLVGAGINFLTLLLLARVLGPEDFGIYLIAMSVAGIVSVFCTLGFPSIVSRFVSRYMVDSRWDLLTGFIRTGRLYIVVAALALLPLAGLGVYFLFDLPESYKLPLLIGCAMAPFLSFVRFNGALANAFRKVIISYLPDLLLRPAIFFAAVVSVYWAGISLDASLAIAIQLIVVAFLTIGQGMLLGRLSSDAPSKVEVEYDRRSWHRAAAPLLIVVLFTSFFADLEVAFLAFLLAPDQVAIFNVCFKITLLLAFGLQAVDQLSLPDISDAHAKGDYAKVNVAIARANHLKLWPSLVVAALIIFFGGDILAAFGEEYREGHVTMIVLALAQLTRAVFGPVTQLLSLSGLQHQSIIVFAASLVFLLAANAILVPAMGLVGAGVAVALATLAWTSALAVLLRRAMGYRSWVLSLQALRG